MKDFFEKPTNEEEFFKTALQAYLRANPQGIEIDIAPLLNLAPCFGLDKDSFEIGIEGDHIVLAINRNPTGYVQCDITKNMASQTKQWENEIELNKFRYGSKEAKMAKNRQKA